MWLSGEIARDPARGRPRAAGAHSLHLPVIGQHVAALVSQVEEAGVHTVPFELAGAAGRRLAPGVYLVKLRAGREQAHLRVVAFE